jgi:PKHD-type hydroxylase
MRPNWQMWSGSLPDEAIQRIIDCAGETERATTFNNADQTMRSSMVSWLTDQKWVLDLLFDYVDTANRAAFNVNINKKADIQFTEYHGSESGHYSWHHDIFWDRADGLDRKLSVTVQLSEPNEYEGGEFSFSEIESPDVAVSKVKGTVLVFPSYLVHAVSPVTSGVRKSLVAWFEGPTWR